nr:cytosolic sulfotransferase 5-like [Tanacetum cinerariifolium]
MDSKVVKDRVKDSETRAKGSSKRVGEELESDKSKKQKLDEKVEAEVDNDQEEVEMKMYMKIVFDDEVAIDAIPLAAKPPIIVDWKIIKEGKISSYHIIRADESSKRKQSDSLEAIFFIWSTFCEVSKSAYLYAGKEKERIVGIKRLLSADEVTATSYEVTTAGYGFYCWVSEYMPFWEHVLSYWSASIETPDKILFLKYEDMKKQPKVVLRNLAMFMGEPFKVEEENKGMVDEIVKLCSFEFLSNLDVNMKGVSSKLKDIFELENKAFFRKGEIGDWKNHLSEECWSIGI